jgi:hypothetical protein
MAYIKTNASDSKFYDLYIQTNGGMYANVDSSDLFMEFWYVESINNLEVLNTSNVTDMDFMFSHAGAFYKTFNTGDLSNWHVGKVTTHINFNAGVTSKITSPIWKK